MIEYIQRVMRSVQNVIRPAKQTANSNETGVISVVQTQFNAFEMRSVNAPQLYGFASATLPTCDHIIVCVSGDNSNSCSIASNDQRYRPKNMKPGETQVYDCNGQSIYIQQDGTISIAANHNVTITCDTGVTITAPTVRVNGNLQVTGSIIAGYGTGDQVGLQTHEHPQGADSHGDSEQDTGPPIAGT